MRNKWIKYYNKKISILEVLAFEYNLIFILWLTT